MRARGAGGVKNYRATVGSSLATTKKVIANISIKDNSTATRRAYRVSPEMKRSLRRVVDEGEQKNSYVLEFDLVEAVYSEV